LPLGEGHRQLGSEAGNPASSGAAKAPCRERPSAKGTVMPERSGKIATRTAGLEPCPDRRADLGFRHSYTVAEFERIKMGLVPEQIEDKWFILFEDPWLYLHRSWTGACIYAVRFVLRDGAAQAVEAWASRDAAVYAETRVDYDRAVLTFLIDALLLGKPAKFPTPSLWARWSKGIYQHHVAGTAHQETTHRPASSIWAKLRRLFIE
jgi:hypothetical protein